MSLHDAGVLAGTVSTTLFVLSYLPMLVKARRTKDLASYSVGNLAIANVGNLIHSVYVFTLPVGPIWVLHTFYLLSTAAMLWWWWRYHGRASQAVRRTPSRAEAHRRLEADLAEMEAGLAGPRDWRVLGPFRTAGS